MDVRQLERTIDRYLAGNATPEEAIFINKWLNRDINERVVLDESSRLSVRADLWRRVSSGSGIDLNLISSHAGIDPVPVKNDKGVIRLFTSYKQLLQYAAMLILVVTGAVLFFTHLTKRPVNSYTSVVALSGKPKVFLLPDSTTVHLFPNSTLSFANDYNVRDRKVQLTGRGFFEVQTNTNHPFSVEAGGMITRVLGTSFEVTANDSATISIIVRSGKVAVDNGDRTLGHLSPDQRLIYHRPENTFNVDEVHAAILCEWWNTGLVFQQAPLQEVVKSISSWYNIPIRISNKKWLAERVTIRLDTASVTEAMSLLSQTLGLTYKKDPNQIVIY